MDLDLYHKLVSSESKAKNSYQKRPQKWTQILLLL